MSRASYTSTWDRLAPASKDEMLRVLAKFEGALQVGAE